MDQSALFAIMFITTMAAGVGVIFMALRQQAQAREMQHRERMAMIERGQVPLAERGLSTGWSSSSAASSRAMSLGIIVVGLGLALMTVISITGGSPEAGVGTGGAIAIIGAAFIVRSLIVKTGAPSPPSPPPPGAGPGPTS
jgi:hypothetical protein